MCTAALLKAVDTKLEGVVNSPGLNCLVDAAPEVMQGLQQAPVTGVGAQHIIDCPEKAVKSVLQCSNSRSMLQHQLGADNTLPAWLNWNSTRIMHASQQPNSRDWYVGMAHMLLPVRLLCAHAIMQDAVAAIMAHMHSRCI